MRVAVEELLMDVIMVEAGLVIVGEDFPGNG